MNIRKFVLPILVVILVYLVFLLGIKEGKRVQFDNSDKFTLEYQNNSSSNNKIRYRYELSFATAQSLTLSDFLDLNENVFTLYKNNETVASILSKNEDKTIIPEFSNTIILKPGEFIEEEFEVVINENLNKIKELIRFDTKIIIEELRSNRWTPVYQVILMKRDKYWSLDKGPIEYLREE